MRLSELEPRFIRYEIRHEPATFIVGDHETWIARGRPTEERIEPREYCITVETLAAAQGIQFLCPACFAANGGAVGTHLIQVTFAGRGVPDAQGSQNNAGQPSRWSVSGSSFEDLALDPSILICGQCAWHGFITKGEAR